MIPLNMADYAIHLSSFPRLHKINAKWRTCIRPKNKKNGRGENSEGDFNTYLVMDYIWRNSTWKSRGNFNARA